MPVKRQVFKLKFVVTVTDMSYPDTTEVTEIQGQTFLGQQSFSFRLLLLKYIDEFSFKLQHI